MMEKREKKSALLSGGVWEGFEGVLARSVPGHLGAFAAPVDLPVTCAQVPPHSSESSEFALSALNSLP